MNLAEREKNERVKDVASIKRIVVAPATLGRQSIAFLRYKDGSVLTKVYDADFQTEAEVAFSPEVFTKLLGDLNE